MELKHRQGSTCWVCSNRVFVELRSQITHTRQSMDVSRFPLCASIPVTLERSVPSRFFFLSLHQMFCLLFRRKPPKPQILTSTAAYQVNRVAALGIGRLYILLLICHSLDPYRFFAFFQKNGTNPSLNADHKLSTTTHKRVYFSSSPTWLRKINGLDHNDVY